MAGCLVRFSRGTVKAPADAQGVPHPPQMQQKCSEHASPATPAGHIVLPALQSETDCDSVTQVQACFTAVTACFYSHGHFKDMQPL